MLPSLDGFFHLGQEFKNGDNCEKWRKEETIGEKVSFKIVYFKNVEKVFKLVRKYFHYYKREIKELRDRKHEIDIY